MANPIISIRLRPVDIAHIEELALLGGYGKGKAGVVRRFVENGIVRAIEQRVIARKDATTFGETAEEEE